MAYTDGESPIVLVEDDEDSRETMQLLLELKGYRVVSASNGREGLQVLEHEGRARLILLDWMMPEMNGREFLEAIQRDSRFVAIPVIVVTAFSGQDHTLPVPHLRKPVPSDELFREVGAACS